MSRSKWKGPFFDFRLYKKIGTKKKHIKTWARSSVILESSLGKYMYIHNGLVFKRVLITRERLGYKFGEFSKTRRYTFKKKLKAKK